MVISKPKKKAYSLLEVVISLAIIAIVVTIMFSTLIMGLQISIVSLARSVLREEISTIANLISRDIRNADFVVDCGSISSTSSSCTFIQKGESFIWSKCNSQGIITNNLQSDLSICKFKSEDDGSLKNLLTTGVNIIVKDFTFSYGFSLENNNIKTNILNTIIVAHKNESYKIDNIIKQTATSTRNY